MPNHIHGIVIINDRRGVFDTPLRGPSNNLGAIIRGYKSSVTKWFRQHTNIYNIWQRNYYEHIVRDDNDFERIANYIRDNPMNRACELIEDNWGQDDFHS